MSYTAESISLSSRDWSPCAIVPVCTRVPIVPLHIIQEAIDNAADEALGGYCKRISGDPASRTSR
jgi:topoisomerase-4 subunit B